MGGTVTASGYNNSSNYEHDGYGIFVLSNSSMTINGGTVTANGNSSNKFGLGIYVLANSSITINGGTVETTGNANSVKGEAYGITAFESSNITINGGTVTASGQSTTHCGCGISVYNESSIAIGGGSITANGSGSNFGYGIAGAINSPITVNDGTVTAIGSTNGIDCQNGSTVTVNQNLSLKAGDDEAHADNSNLDTAMTKKYVKIESSTPQPATSVSYQSPVYNSTDDAASGLKNFETKTVSDYTLVTSNTSAVTWGTDGQNSWYVVSGSGISLSSGVTIKGNVNLILMDGCELTVTGGSNGVIVQDFSSATKNLTIYEQTSGTGTITVTGNSNSNGIDVNDLTINGGNITATSNVSSAIRGGSSLTINGGTIKATGYTNSIIGGSNLTINGGTITTTGTNNNGLNGYTITINGGKTIANSGRTEQQAISYIGTITVNTNMSIKAGDSANPTKEVDLTTALTKQYVTIEPGQSPANEDYACINETTKVTYSSIQTAIDAVGTDQTIKLTTDVAIKTIKVASDQKFTLDLNGHTIIGTIQVHGNLTVKDSGKDGKIYKEDVSWATAIKLTETDATFTLESGTLQAKATGASGWALAVENSATKASIYIKGGSVKASAETINAYAIIDDWGSNGSTYSTAVDITGGIFEGQLQLQNSDIGDLFTYTGHDVDILNHMMNAKGKVKIILNDNVTVSGLTVPEYRNVTLDLNGYVLSGNGSGSVITNNGNLTIQDSNTGNQTHNFKVGSDGLWTLTSDAKTVDCESITTRPAENAVVAVKGGVITGGKGSSVNNGHYSGVPFLCGGGVLVAPSASFTMNGGNIIGNTANCGAGVHVNKVIGGASGTMTMNSGSIMGNVSDNSGGGVCISGTMIMNDGSISNNIDNMWGGGGVYVLSETSVFTMNGGSITSNHTSHSTNGAGGGVNVDYGKFIMTGGTVSGNTSMSKGGGVILCKPSASITLGGTAKITGNTVSNVVNNLYICSDKTVKIDSTKPLTTGAKIGVTAETTPTAGDPTAITSNGSSTDAQYIASDNEAYYVEYNDASPAHLELAIATVKIDAGITNGTVTVDNMGANADEKVAITATANVNGKSSVPHSTTSA